MADDNTTSSSNAPLQSWRAEVTNIVDGDTFDVIWLDGYSPPDGLQDRIRIAGVDTNEIAKDDVPVSQPFADDATDRLAELIPVGSIVTLYAQDENSQSFDRPLRHVFNDDGINVATVLIQEGLGLATSYEFEPDFRDDYFTAVEIAIQNEVGMWEPGAAGGGDPATWPEVKMFVNYDATHIDEENLNDEFIHIENNGPGQLDLSGWSFRKDGRSAQTEVPNGTVLDAGEVFRIYVGSGTDTANSMYLGLSEPFFNNDQDVLYLRDEFLNMRGYQSWPGSIFTGPESSIVIDSIQYDAPGEDTANLNGEWIIIRNAGDETVDLRDWRIKHESGDYVFGNGENLAAGDKLKIFIGSGTDAGSDRYWGNSENILSNEGGVLRVQTPYSQAVDVFTWGAVENANENPRGAIKMVANFNAEGNDLNNANGEWVALYNSSDSDIDLTGFSLRSGPQSYDFASGTMLAAGTNMRVLVGSGSDSALVKHWGNSGPILTNGGDAVDLLNADGDVILRHEWPAGQSAANENGIVIDQVNFDAPGSDSSNPNGEWFTLRNASSTEQNLVNWQLNVGASHHYTFLEDKWLGPDETLKIYIGSGTDTDSEVFWGKSAGILNNDGSVGITLLAPDRTIMETHSWGSASSPVQSVGAAIELTVNYDAVGSDAANPNGEWVSLTNLSSSTISLDGHHLYTDGTSYVFDSNDTLDAGERMRVYLGSGSDNGFDRYANGNLSAFNNTGDEIALRLNETEGVVSDFTFPFTGQKLIPGQFEITAVNYDAPGADADNPNGEWFEITNTGSQSADLQDWRVQYATATFFDFTESTVVAAGDTVRVFMGIGTDTSTEFYWGRESGTLNNSGAGLLLKSNYRTEESTFKWNTSLTSDDTILGTDGADRIQSGGGNDKVFGLKGNDIVELGDGNDYVKVGGGLEEFHGGAGTDYISYYDSTGGVTLNLATNSASGSWASNDTITSFESVSGSNTGGDTIFGTSGANTIRTYGGNDKVYAGKGADRVELGAGNDYVKVGGGVEIFHGGTGTDYISYYDSTGGVTLNLATNSASGSWASNDTITSFESVSGSNTGGDTIYGTSGANTIRTYGGNDKVYAGTGADRIELGAGNDYVRVGGGQESFDGGSGTDYISYFDSTGGITIDLEADSVSGSWAVNDTVKNFESASGSGVGNDTMMGTSGANTLKGFGGNDLLFGRSGDDKLYGGDGQDRFDGGAGTDLLYGGADQDTFHFDFGEDHDIIKDFENNIDTIELDNFTFAAGQDAFDFANQVGDDVVFTFDGGDVLTVENATIAQLFNDLELV